MISPLDARVMDLNAEALGMDTAVLMDNAGKAVADLIDSRFPGKRVRIFCGRGNNGGDGLVCAYYLKDAGITMVDGSVMKTAASSAAAERVSDRMEPFTGEESDFDILVDAGLGTGISGQLRPVWDRYVDFCNSFEGTIISVDVPTGFSASKQVVPDITITMVDAKTGMDPVNSGEIIVADIGMPQEAETCTGPGDILRYPIPGAESHKGEMGRVLIVGGGPFFGAPAFAARAAMRIGADMVYVATPSRAIPFIVSHAPEAMMIELPGNILTPDDVGPILEKAASCDVVLIGPGLGTAPDTIEAVRAVLERLEKPCVIDADGITAVSRDAIKLPSGSVVTPHLAEFIRLGGTERDPGDVLDTASELGCTVLLKGHTDIISDGERISLNNTGCAAMASAGTGDILAGTVAGLMARGMAGFDAAKLAAWIVGKAGESVFSEMSYGLCATDLEDEIARQLTLALANAGL
ncbi:MAG: NAD(P)H-hydrate dehydratase [Thermoplasmata archaeon]|nr:NAD(P)H-hydrate dehydratase [Thermoplasmata archaeon]